MVVDLMVVDLMVVDLMVQLLNWDPFDFVGLARQLQMKKTLFQSASSEDLYVVQPVFHCVYHRDQSFEGFVLEYSTRMPTYWPWTWSNLKLKKTVPFWVQTP